MNKLLLSNEAISTAVRDFLKNYHNLGVKLVGLNNILFKYNLYIHINDTSNTGFDSKHNAYI